LLYMRNRYYSTGLGRFLTRDPIGVWGDPMNLGCEYGYVGCLPLVQGDSLGLQTDTFHPPLLQPTTAGREAFKEDLADRVSRGQIGLCEAFGQWIDYLAESSETYAEFRQAMRDGVTLPLLGGTGNDAEEISGRRHGSGGSFVDGWNTLAYPNGADNFDHFAGGLALGIHASLLQAAKDSAELLITTNPEHEAETVAEIYADAAAIVAGVRLASALRHHSWLFGWSRGAWACERHLPGRYWRTYFGSPVGASR